MGNFWRNRHFQYSISFILAFCFISLPRWEAEKTDVPSPLLFAGDTLFAGSVGRVDLPGADVAKQRETLKRLKTMPSHLRVLSGHGAETTLGMEQQTNPFMLGL